MVNTIQPQRSHFCKAPVLPPALRDPAHPLHPTAGVYTIESPLTSNIEVVTDWWISLCRWLKVSPNTPVLGVGVWIISPGVKGVFDHCIVIKTNPGKTMIGLVENNKFSIPSEKMCSIALMLGWFESASQVGNWLQLCRRFNEDAILYPITRLRGQISYPSLLR